METDTEFSARWESGPTPRIAAVVSSYRRSEFLPGLVAALENQTLSPDDYEIVLVDNGSQDGTWDALRELARASRHRMAVTMLAENNGPGGGRNHGVRLVRAPLLAFTDDDCMPSPGWLEATIRAFEAGADVIQGQVHPDPSDRDQAGPWFHTKWIEVPTPFFETCNVAYRVDGFRSVGGFDMSDSLTSRTAGGRAFGEDALLAWRIQEAGGRPHFSRESLVYHRNIPAGFKSHLDGQRGLAGFPGLANRSPLVARWLWKRLFLTRDTAVFDLAVASVAAAAVARRPWLALGALPWLRKRTKEARVMANGDARLFVARTAQLATADAVALYSLAKGSIRHRRLVL